MTLHPAVIERTAVFSDCNLYRYELISLLRDGDGTRCVFVMLNPSTATHEQDDPTVRRCMEFARRWGHSAAWIVNLFAFRSPRPKDLKTAEDPVGPANDQTIRRTCRGARRVICAWGRGGDLFGRADTVLQLLKEEDIRPECLGLTKDGHPKHPLARGKHRIPDDFAPIPFGKAA